MFKSLYVRRARKLPAIRLNTFIRRMVTSRLSHSEVMRDR